jgi:hypothetical protein
MPVTGFGSLVRRLPERDRAKAAAANVITMRIEMARQRIVAPSS